jgi:hypothetical protein
LRKETKIFLILPLTARKSDNYIGSNQEKKQRTINKKYAKKKKSDNCTRCNSPIFIAILEKLKI